MTKKRGEGKYIAVCYNLVATLVATEVFISKVTGFTRGLKHNQLRRIEKLATRRVAADQIISPELARQMSELSHETGRQIGVLLNRKGQVEFVMVGTAKQIEMPDFGRARVSSDRFRGLRCVHTHLAGEKLTQDDLTDLALLRLDLMSIVQVDRKNGLPGLVYSAHLLPESGTELQKPAHEQGHTQRRELATQNGSESSAFDDEANSPAIALAHARAFATSDFEFLEPAIPAHLDANFSELINSLEDEMARVRQTARNRQTGRERAILVGVTTGDIDVERESLNELTELALSADVVVLDSIIQRRPQIDSKTVLGKGKLDDLLIRSMRLGADIIVFDTELTPTQVRVLSEATELKVIDRPQLILDIFAQRAQSREGKLQVELAQLKYLLPRLVMGQNSAFSRLAGGIGGRGPGETKLETDRRRVRTRISQLEKQVDNLGRQRHERRKTRVQKHLPIISLVGYTNAGKSTLLNQLTQSDVYAERKMFATLDPTSRRLRLPYDQEVIINDTVGFIRDLPETLVSAFRATLEEIADSDLLVHVVDAKSARVLQQIASVNKILADLNFGSIPQLIVLNKSDLLAREEIEILKRQILLDSGLEAVAISAIRRETLRPMVEIVGTMISVSSSEFQVSSAVS
ncbi:MAG: GTPase HflX [Pyrinomonadaceae bacterium]